MDVRNKIVDVLKDIMLSKADKAVANDAVPEILPKHELSNDLGLKSLDLAELVATLELEIGHDPFARDNAVTDVRTVEDLFRVYQTKSSLPDASMESNEQSVRRAASRKSVIAAASKRRSAHEQE